MAVGLAALPITHNILARNDAPPAPKELPMSQPAEDIRDYAFTYRAEGGGERSPGIFTYLTDIRVSGKAGRAAMLLNRHNGDLAGRPVGLFASTLQPGMVGQIASAIEDTRWADLPQPTKGDVNATMLMLDYSRGPKIIRREFNARNLEFIRSIGPVMKSVDEVGAALLSHPSRAVSVVANRTSSGFSLTITNVGFGPVIIGDPRPSAKGEGGSVTFNVALAPEQKPGTFAMPPIWQPVPLAPGDGDRKPVELAPGKGFTADSAPWPAPEAGGKFVVQAVWSDYDGPVVDEKTVMGALPDPQSDDVRPYVVRGAAFSRFVNFVVEKK